MPPAPPPESLVQLAEAWRATTGPSRRRAAAAAIGSAVVGALLVARHGTVATRAAACGMLVASVILAVGWRVVELRRLRRADRIVRGLARRADPARADRALRALSLDGATAASRRDGTSPELARLHLARVLDDLPATAILERASRSASWVASAALLVGICAAGALVARAWSVVEGGDVLLAHHGVAPFAVRWIDEVEIVARPPEYLRQPERHQTAMAPLAVPFGTSLTVRGLMAHPGRRLFLSDGVVEVPFVDDGAGAEVARWSVARSGALRAVARFGEVVIQDEAELPVESIPDAAPVVELEGAPKVVRLVEQTEDLPVKYEASDDHGLREVHLVLRSGTREERRVLARLDGVTTTDRGGVLLKLRDPFLKKSHVPVQVTVEAKDNDPLSGPKWGASPALTLVPPDVGEPEALRLDALRRVRDALVDTLAWRLSTLPPAEAAARKAFVAEVASRTGHDEQLLESTLADSYGGLRIATRLRALLRAQVQKTRAAVDAEERSPTKPVHGRVVQAAERLVLVVDAVVRGLGSHDARDAARSLADVADDLATGAAQARDASLDDARAQAGQRMDAAVLVLAGGGRALTHLGSLGRDLGEIVDADLARVARARDEDDRVHAELAARDLAARLHQPDPSFGSRGTVGRGGGESGGGHGTPGEDGEDSGDEVDRAQAAAEQDLERLAQDHAGEIGKMEQALSSATSPEELEALRQEAKKHAEAVREAVRDLPSVGMGSDSWTSKGSAARELAEQMAGSIEALRPEEAVQSGRSAAGALDEAKKILRKDAWMGEPGGREDRTVDGARRKLDAEVAWAEEQLAQMRRHAAERARKDLEQGGQDEDKLADRARELRERAHDKGSMPEQALQAVEEAEDAARQAARALQQGDADKGLERQRAAQRSLEAARQQMTGDGDDPGTSGQAPQDDGKSRGGQVDIPGAKEHKGPEDFRRRVVQGLGQPAGGSLKEAVRRYAEGLLR